MPAGTRGGIGAALIVTAVLAAACGGGADTTTTTSPPAPTTTGLAVTTSPTTDAAEAEAATAVTGEEAVEQPAPGPMPDLRFEEFGPLGAEGTATFTLEEGDVSFLFFAFADGALDPIFVTEIIAPDGADLMDLAGVDTDTYLNFGEVAAFMPASAAVEIIPGEYAVTVATDGTAVAGAGVIVKSGDADGPQAIDVTFWLVTTDESLSDPIVQDEVAAAFREVGDAILGPHGLAVGRMAFLDAPEDVIDGFAELPLPSNEDSDAAQKELCRLMAEAVGVSRALNFAIVDRVVDPDDPDGVTEGNAPALPGTVMVPGAFNSCVVGAAAPDEFEPERDILARANVVWHEAGHLLGLFHTTEADGFTFDIIEDTAECPADRFDENGDEFVDAFECESADGLNFMFHDSDGTAMTAEQAFVLANHPLFYPAG